MAGGFSNKYKGFSGVEPLLSELDGVTPIEGGGTNSSTALTNNKLMRSAAGAIVESALISNGSDLIGVAYAANSGASITLDPANGKFQVITLTANCTATMAAVPASSTESETIFEFVQDGTGGRTLSWAASPSIINGNTSISLNTTPLTINSAIGTSTYISVIGKNAGYLAFPTAQGLGITDASSAPAGYIGEVITSTLAIGSATSLTTATGKSITSITLTAGDWMVSGNIGFIAAAGTLPTVLTASISATDNTQATSPNGGAFNQMALAFTAASTNVLPLAGIRVNISATTTYYLVATATFTVSTLTGYGSITARRFR